MENTPANFQLSVAPNALSIGLHEPVEVEISVKNMRPEARPLLILGSLTVELELTHIKPDGSREKSPGPTWARGPDAAWAAGEIPVEPGKAYSQPLLISEWFDSFFEGRHIIEIGWGENTPVFVTVAVGPRDESRLRRLVEELGREAQLPNAERSLAAIAKLRCIPDDVVLPVAVELSKNTWTETDAVELLKEFDSPEAVTAFGAMIRRNSPGTGFFLQSWLRYLRDRSARADVRQMIDEILKPVLPSVQ